MEYGDGCWLRLAKMCCAGSDALKREPRAPAPTREDARYWFAQVCEKACQIGRKRMGETVEPRWNRPPVADPETHPKPYVEFLVKQGARTPCLSHGGVTTLRGGITFSKVFTFEYDVLGRDWQARYGLDMHLDPRWKDFPKTSQAPLALRWDGP